MAELYLHDKRIESVFQLLGEVENDISNSFAWALTKCPSFLDAFVQSQIKPDTKYGDLQIRLQQAEERKQEGGITDIEISSPGYFNVIIEAKRGLICC